MKTYMKKDMKHFIQSSLLASLLLNPLSSQASVVLNVTDAVSKLIGHTASVINVFDAEKRGLNSGSSKYQPWSGSYWPDILGGIANHYRDHGTFGDQFLFALRYGIAHGRVQGDFKNVCDKYDTFSPDDINQKLSPAEKYDLLLGDTSFSFARAILDDVDFRAHYLKKSKMMDGSDSSDTEPYEGVNNNDHFADVQSSYSRFDNDVAYRYWKKRGDSLSYWFGICDGWSPASIYLPRPVKPVTVTGALGHKITFYPDDLKALGSYLFARTNNDYMTTMNYQFAGRPCAEGGDPATDDMGYVKDFRCNDLDAGLWHLALLNRIGVDKMGIMMDIDNNKKINNHPFGIYSLTYFNPATGEDGTLQQSVVNRSAVTDGYARRRNAKTVYLVGVKSTVRYRYYQWPEDNKDKVTDGESQDITKEKTFVYDLELDAGGNVLGGEWGNRFDEIVDPDSEDADSGTPGSVKYADQPDFIWMAKKGDLPFSEQSVYTYAGAAIDPSNPRPFGNTQWTWDGKSALPEDWVRAAKADEVWRAPVVGSLDSVDGKKGKEVFPVEARDSLMKSAQPLSNIVYYLFDQARLPTDR